MMSYGLKSRIEKGTKGARASCPMASYPMASCRWPQCPRPYFHIIIDPNLVRIRIHGQRILLLLKVRHLLDEMQLIWTVEWKPPQLLGRGGEIGLPSAVLSIARDVVECHIWSRNGIKSSGKFVRLFVRQFTRLFIISSFSVDPFGSHSSSIGFLAQAFLFLRRFFFFFCLEALCTRG